MTRIRIEVTQDDIDKGQPCGWWSCPIARAASRVLGQRVAASGYGLAIQGAVGEPVHYMYSLSKATIRRMSRYDALHGMQPFAFYATRIRED